ncbi:FMN-binding glutamate synthase family protein [Wenzhouxiangella marina]|uniref:Glutamate synthase n=1 Tax=Wenzhouxiangella marina TaxID=1579979 RepID=A0A0K0XT48_9GAMM|nr:FMN-binding glutamate synthase family protein [Wenzhouxiangella marina]AKS40791.1 glutamate synthase [Wenzhouxiangella marina]MBB6087664.1 glutamate synthase domain-containing protein 2 [Wenzhouxiangella marina]
MSEILDLSLRVLQFMAALFVLVIGLLVLTGLVLWVIDRTQTRHSIRRNYPVIGRFRYVFEHLGEFFRQYFFAFDREELPFNRAQRSWVYRAAKNVDHTAAFGSTRDLRPEGTTIFLNCAFPRLDEESAPPAELTFGPDCRYPYTTDSFFNISGMSYGALSKPAVQALSAGAAEAGIWLNTGEGGLSDWHLEGGCDLVFQIGTAKFGVRDADGNLSEEALARIASIERVRMFELKLAQGAKPGKGGILPKAKITDEIARIRMVSKDQDAISPNRHREIANVEELLDMIGRIRSITGKPCGFKMVLGQADALDDLCQAIHRRGPSSAPDFITIDSGDGGTGAAPMTLMDDVGLPLSEALPMLVDKLNEYGLKSRIPVIASGKRINPVDVAWALCAGADVVQAGRGFMFALGCIQAMQCNKNTCPTGVTTHDKHLQRGLVPEDKAKRVAWYARHMVREVSIIAHSCGVTRPRLLRREHARVVVSGGRSVLLSELWPNRTPLEPYRDLADA